MKSPREVAEDAAVELAGKMEDLKDYRMLIIYVKKDNTRDVRMDRSDFADWELGSLMHYVLEMEFGGQMMEDDDGGH